MSGTSLRRAKTKRQGRNMKKSCQGGDTCQIHQCPMPILLFHSYDKLMTNYVREKDISDERIMSIPRNCLQLHSRC